MNVCLILQTFIITTETGIASSIKSFSVRLLRIFAAWKRHYILLRQKYIQSLTRFSSLIKFASLIYPVFAEMWQIDILWHYLTLSPHSCFCRCSVTDAINSIIKQTFIIKSHYNTWKIQKKRHTVSKYSIRVTWNIKNFFFGRFQNF